MTPRLPHLDQALGRRARPGSTFLPDAPMGDAPPAFADGAPRLQSYRVVLTPARNTPEKIPLSGNCLWVQEASPGECRLTIRLGDPTGAPMVVGRGFFLRGFPFRDVWIEHASQNARHVLANGTAEIREQSMTLVAGDGIDPYCQNYDGSEVHRGYRELRTNQQLLAAATFTQILWHNFRRRHVYLKALKFAVDTVVYVHWNNLNPAGDGYVMNTLAGYGYDLCLHDFAGPLWVYANQVCFVYMAETIDQAL